MSTHIRTFKKILVANRGEIAIRVLRAASELHIRTVAIYSYEDRYSLHRYKADEAYMIGNRTEPLKPYLDIEAIVSVAKSKGVDAIHPGYGFLSENVDFVRACEAAGIVFIGPRPDVMESLGDKVKAKELAKKVEVPLIPDSQKPLLSLSDALGEAKRIGYPLMLKAASGGGGRGMRVVRSEEALNRAFQEARNEALKAFGDDTVFLEKFIENPKHIEVQLLGDNSGNLVHLFERDCSVQRRFQKVVEVAPSTLSPESKNKLYEYALKIGRGVQYNNAGTVEFLVDDGGKGEIYFIEVNPRIQVEHTITEEITGIDIVRSQILIAAGARLTDPQILIESQESLTYQGFAVQCRITTEDPASQFKPDYGEIIAYRSASGFGIRLDAGSSYVGARISPFFDSMLVKITGKGRTLKGATQRLDRALREFRVRGVKTNIPFLINVVNNKTFQQGEATVKFIEENPTLVQVKQGMDRGTKTLSYLGKILVNGNKDVKAYDPKRKFRIPIVPAFSKNDPYPKGSRDQLKELGREAFIAKIKADPAIHYTDTTFRDAHQSLLATRMRTMDMFLVAESFAKAHPELFSMEVWGGATFDVCLRFLKEDPWDRLRILRSKIPNILFQMLLRGSNAVGYKAYPDNLVQQFIVKAAETGIDIFRIFDSLNWLEAMKVSIRTVREETDSLAEACICYTGDINDPDPGNKYNLQYYVDFAKQLEDEGAHILAIKDMAGLLKPLAAERLVSTLRESLAIPIHLHTHDTSSNQATTYLKAVEAGVDIVDMALSSMSGMTSQPNFNSFVSIMEGHKREQKMDVRSLNQFANYWEAVREYYYPFESELRSGTAEVYQHEIPGGQYSNLLPQARSLGLEKKFEQIKQNYAIVNRMFGHIVKVTPSSKVVGDMALFMTSNELTEQDIFEKGDELSFPDSVKSFFRGDLGQPVGGFPRPLQKIILKDEKPYTDRPNKHLKAIDFEKAWKEFKQEFPDDRLTDLDMLSYLLYGKVFRQYYDHLQQFDEVMNLPTEAFFYPMKRGEEILVRIAPGKKLLIEYMYRLDADDEGMSAVFFRLNGQTRSIKIKDEAVKVEKVVNKKASAENEVGSPLQGRLTEVFVEPGDVVKKNQPLFVIEAMKMESTIAASRKGTVRKVHLSGGTMVEQDDLVVELE
ncbi:MAG: pyruvate carboxylase [Bacteroidota bacterium]